jgi:hypothetical protein
MTPSRATLITQISPNLTYNKVDALLYLKNVSLAPVNTKVNTIQKLKHSNLITDLTKDNTWAFPTYPENKQMLMHISICSQFVSTAFCKTAVERFMKVEKLGSTTEFGRKIINSFAV